MNLPADYFFERFRFTVFLVDGEALDLLICKILGALSSVVCLLSSLDSLLFFDLLLCLEFLSITIALNSYYFVLSCVYNSSMQRSEPTDYVADFGVTLRLLLLVKFLTSTFDALLVIFTIFSQILLYEGFCWINSFRDSL